MNSTKLIFWLIFTIITFASHATTTYFIEPKASQNRLLVHLDREKLAPTKFILRGASMGIKSQVRNLSCDGKFIEEDKPGVWSIPAGCKTLRWQIPLLNDGEASAEKQQSMHSHDAMLISEASSLPRLKNETTSEQVAIPKIANIFPKPNNNGFIPLPKKDSAPFFILLNAGVLDSQISETIHLTYLLDTPKYVSALPDIALHMRGLSWLNTLIPMSKKEHFTVAWLGMSKNHLLFSGAAGENMLLANYAHDGSPTDGKAMLLYVALHEAFHQFAMHYPNQPVWVAESLAAYYGARATQIALSHDSESEALMARFKAAGADFSDGLITIHQKVLRGDYREYGAFYTKGLAFWMAVDRAIQEKNGMSLDKYLTQIFQMHYDEDGKPLEMQETLELSPETWKYLRRQFLD